MLTAGKSHSFGKTKDLLHTNIDNFLPAGTYQYTYFLDTVIPGSYQVMPTLAREAYFPEVNGRAAGLLFTIAE